MSIHTQSVAASRESQLLSALLKSANIEEEEKSSEYNDTKIVEAEAGVSTFNDDADVDTKYISEKLAILASAEAKNSSHGAEFNKPVTTTTTTTYNAAQLAYLASDPGLACLEAQLARVNEQIRQHEEFKKKVADAEEQCKQDLLAKEYLLASSSSVHERVDEQKPNPWEQYFDDEVGTDYWFNATTGEATWIQPLA